jgi:hypothetical protein
MGAYAAAARRYRSVAHKRAEDPVLGQSLSRISRMAEVALLTSTPRRPAKPAAEPFRNVLLLLIALLVLAAGGIVVQLLRSAGGPR